GRPLFGAPVEGVSYCLMHFPQGKDDGAFQEEFERTLVEAKRRGTLAEAKRIRAETGAGVDYKHILAETKIGADFTRFVFPSANYRGREFKVNCAFFDAVFKQNAEFGNTRFEQGVDFKGARFEQNADFTGAEFTPYANFTDATFAQDA